MFNFHPLWLAGGGVNCAPAVTNALAGAACDSTLIILPLTEKIRRKMGFIDTPECSWVWCVISPEQDPSQESGAFPEEE